MKKGSRLPEDWKPSPSARLYARGLGFDEKQIDALGEDFRDHWLAKAGKDGIKADWLAAWRLWCRRDIQYNGHPNTRRPRNDGPRYTGAI